MPIHNKLQTSQPFLAQVHNWNVYNRNFYDLDLNNMYIMFTSKDPHFPTQIHQKTLKCQLSLYEPWVTVVLITG